MRVPSRIGSNPRQAVLHRILARLIVTRPPPACGGIGSHFQTRTLKARGQVPFDAK
jgi:hypothetical protein